MRTVVTAILLCATLATRAQTISHIETTRSWYYVYDEKGKKIKTLSTSSGKLKGYSSSFYVIQQSSYFFATYTPTGKKLHTFSLSTTGEIIAVAGDTFTTQKGTWIYTWSKDGRKISTRPARR